MNNHLQIRDKFSNGRKVNFSEIMPTRDEVNERLNTIKYNNTNDRLMDDLIVDEEYGTLKPESKISYIRYNGKYVIEDIKDNHEGIRIIDDVSGQFIEIYFPDAINKFLTVNEMTGDRPMKQISTGFSLDKLINRKFETVMKVSAFVAVTAFILNIFKKK